jgi:hypothetical protein
VREAEGIELACDRTDFGVTLCGCCFIRFTEEATGVAGFDMEVVVAAFVVDRAGSSSSMRIGSSSVPAVMRFRREEGLLGARCPGMGGGIGDVDCRGTNRDASFAEGVSRLVDLKETRKCREQVVVWV